MTRIAQFAALVALIMISSYDEQVVAQTDPVVIRTVNNLHNNTYGVSTKTVVAALQGYNSAFDGGGGLLTSDGTVNSCDTANINGTSSTGSNQITNVGGGSQPFPTNIALQMTIPANTLNFPSGDHVSAFDPVNKTITVAPYNATTGTTGTFTLNGDNGGTIFKDQSNYCFTRVTRGYNQVE